MQFKELERKDIVSDEKIVCSNCTINICGVIRIGFQINHDPEENKYYLYAFGKGSIRRLQPATYDSLERAKSAAYGIYSYEMTRIKKAVDYMVVT